MAASKTSFPAISPDGNLSRYLEQIRSFPMLEQKQEYMLAKSWKERGDVDAAHQLVTSHLRLVAKIAMGYRGYGLPVADLISEGNLGMMHAVKKFEPEKGFRLATYAMWWIKAAIQEYILRSWSLVKIGTTAGQKKLFFNLRRIKGQIQAIDDGDLKPEQVTQIATRLDVSEAEVISMNQRMAGNDRSLNVPLSRDGEGSGEWQDWLEDDSEDQETTFAEHEEFSARKRLMLEAMQREHMQGTIHHSTACRLVADRFLEVLHMMWPITTSLPPHYLYMVVDTFLEVLHMMWPITYNGG